MRLSHRMPSSELLAWLARGVTWTGRRLRRSWTGFDTRVGRPHPLLTCETVSTGYRPLAAYLFNRQVATELISPWIRTQEAATSILVYGEVIEYLRSRPHFPKRYRQLRELLRGVFPYFLTYPIPERYADIRRQLRKPQGPGLIGDIDTLIAATALEGDLIVVTADADFERVPGLKMRLITLRA